MTYSAYERVGEYVKSYNEASANGDRMRAMELAKLAIRDAKDGLNDPNALELHRSYFKDVINSLSLFLENPLAAVKTAASGTEPFDPSAKIKTTNWFDAPIPNLGLKDIAGLKDLKNEFIVNVFAPILPEYSDIYQKYRGEENGFQILLYGPPGTGKTHAVKCLAGELKCKIAVVKISDVLASLVGDGAKIITEIFNQASEHERCIIFFDEIDTIASNRDHEDSRHTKEQLTTLLTNMDGFTSKVKPGQLRIVIAATNRPWALDSAVKRGGRFDTQLYVPLPDKDARKQLIRMALSAKSKSRSTSGIPLSKDVTLDWLTERTDGFSGADIKSICKQASNLPMRREIFARINGQSISDCVTVNDFEEVFSKYINAVTDEALIEFDAYRLNLNPGAEYTRIKCDRMICDYYKIYLSLENNDTSISNSVSFEKFEEKFFWRLYDNGYIVNNFSKKYDLSFLDKVRPRNNP